jgi:soluble lytic murein transglycosylase-like protein
MGEAKFSALLGATFYGTTRTVNYVPVSFGCPPLASDKREDLISEAARRESIEPALVRAVMQRESAFHPCAVSIKGALGLMQLMPATLAQFHVSDPFDPAQSVHAGVAFLRTLLDKYQGDLRLTLAAYNAGPARVENTDPATYPSETKNYVADILGELGIATSQNSTKQ